jgi:hypothetical protein
MLTDLDRLVREAAGRPVVLDAFPTVYYDETGPTLEPIGPELPEPTDELILSLLAERYPGVTFEPADEFPAIREPDPEPLIVYAR